MTIDSHADSATPSKNETKTIGWIGESGTRILPFYYFLLLYRTSNEHHYVLLLLLWRYHLYAFDHFAWIARHALPFVYRIFDSVYALRAELNDNLVRAVHVECGDAHTIARNRMNDVRVMWMCIRISSSIFRSFFCWFATASQPTSALLLLRYRVWRKRPPVPTKTMEFLSIDFPFTRTTFKAYIHVYIEHVKSMCIDERKLNLYNMNAMMWWWSSRQHHPKDVTFTDTDTEPLPLSFRNFRFRQEQDDSIPHFSYYFSVNWI